MLRLLRVRNLAVIEAVEVEFEPGLNVLTGETGAGKSILIEALGLLLGARSSADLVRTGAEQASVEALFETPAGEELIIRRDITSQGRSRSYINGDLATVGAVRGATASLVEIHGQHEHHALRDVQRHVDFLDAFGSLGHLRTEVGAAWAVMQSSREALRATELDADEKSTRTALIDSQLTEIEDAAPQEGEDLELEQQQRVLANAEQIRAWCDDAFAALYDRDDSALPLLAGVWRDVEELAAIDHAFQPYLDARPAIKGQLEELADTLRRFGETVEPSPARLQSVGERLALLDRLKLRHGPDLVDVLKKARQLRQEREDLTASHDRQHDLRQRLEAAEAAYDSVAARLSKARRVTAPTLVARLQHLLAGLALPSAKLEVRFRDNSTPAVARRQSGSDEVEFFLSPNPGEALRPLAQIASGGELSRIMLAFKTAGAEGVGEREGAVVAAMVFDEVDAGIGGRVADVVGAHLHELGGRHQVLCITHLPQIAARGDTHFHIDKSVAGGRTTTRVVRLSPGDRVAEIGRMMGGATVTKSVLAGASELLAAAGAKGKTKAKAKG